MSAEVEAWKPRCGYCGEGFANPRAAIAHLCRWCDGEYLAPACMKAHEHVPACRLYGAKPGFRGFAV